MKIITLNIKGLGSKKKKKNNKVVGKKRKIRCVVFVGYKIR